MNWAAITASVALVSGVGMVIAGTYLLAGPGWSLLVGACPFLLLGAVILRGLRDK